MCPLFLSRAPTNELKYNVCLSKTVYGISIFDFVSLLIKFIVLFNKMQGLVGFETS